MYVSKEMYGFGDGSLEEGYLLGFPLNGELYLSTEDDRKASEIDYRWKFIVGWR